MNELHEKMFMMMINNVYKIDLENLDSTQEELCLKTTLDESWLWHRRLCHASMHTIRKITRSSLVRGVPQLEFSSEQLCEACQLGKLTKASFKSTDRTATSRPLETLHMDRSNECHEVAKERY